MLRVRQLSPDGNDTLRTVDIPSDALTVGRAADNDLRIDQPTVSSQHLKVLWGLVVADCGSLNGTFVAGERIKGATLIPSGETIELGGTGTRLAIDFVADEAPDGPETGPSGTIVAQRVGGTESARHTPLGPTGTRPPAPEGAAPAEPSTRELSDSTHDEPLSPSPSRQGATDTPLGIRVSELGAGEDLQAELATLRTRNSELSARLDELVERCEGLDRERGDALDQNAGLEAEKARLAEALEQTRERLAAVEGQLEELRRDPPMPAAEEAAAPEEGGGLFAHLQLQIRRQQEHIRKLESERSELGAGGTTPAVDVERQAQLESENADLRGRLRDAEREIERLAVQAEQLGRSAVDDDQTATAEAVVTPVPAQSAQVSQLELELEQERARNRDLTGRLRVAQSSSVRAGEPAALQPGEEPGVRGLWEIFAHREIEGREPLLHAPAEDFLTLETLRLVRKIERVSTRLAQDSIGTLPRDTFLPGQTVNLRSLAARVLADAADSESRREFKAHADELTRWLLVSLASHRKAAEVLVAEVCDRLSERALTEEAPLGARARFVGKEAELWRRASQVVSELTPAFVEDRLDELARREAGSLLTEQS